MDDRLSRRALLRTGARTTAAAGLAGTPVLASAADERVDRADITAGTPPTGHRPGDGLPGFHREWAETHVENGETRVAETVASIGEGDALVVGQTSPDGSLAEQRIWVGEFGKSGTRWTKTLRADGSSNRPRVVVADDHYLVFWRGSIDGEEAKRVTKVAPDGNIRFQRTISFGFAEYVDVVATDDGYLGLTADTLWAVDDTFESASSMQLPDPTDDVAGRSAETIVPVDDGYVVTGTTLSESDPQAFWVVKVTGVGGTVEWTNAYGFDENVFDGVGAPLGDGGVVVVGGYVGGADDPVAVGVASDGQRRWTQVPSIDGPAEYRDVHVDDVGIRALGRFDGRLGVITYDADGAELGRWREGGERPEVYPTSFDAVGDDRFVVGVGMDDPGNDARAGVLGVKRNERPDPSISVAPTDPLAGQQFTLDASESTDSDTLIESFEWDLDGDGDPEESGERVTTSFADAGTHEVTVRVVDAVGAAAEATVTVSVGENKAPTASVTASADAATVGESVTFEATDVEDAETSVRSLVWYRNGSVRAGEGESVTLSFDDPGEHEVVLAIVDTTGLETRVSTTVTVVEPTTTASERDDGTSAEGTGDDAAAGQSDDGSSRDDGLGSTPGFGVGSAVAAVTAGAGALARRLRHDE